MRGGRPSQLILASLVPGLPLASSVAPTQALAATATPPSHPAHSCHASQAPPPRHHPPPSLEHEVEGEGVADVVLGVGSLDAILGQRSAQLCGSQLAHTRQQVARLLLGGSRRGERVWWTSVGASGGACWGGHGMVNLQRFSQRTHRASTAAGPGSVGSSSPGRQPPVARLPCPPHVCGLLGQGCLGVLQRRLQSALQQVVGAVAVARLHVLDLRGEWVGGSKGKWEVDLI